MKKVHCYLLALIHHHFLRRHSGGATLQTWNSFLCKMLMLWTLTKAERSYHWTEVCTTACIFTSENIFCHEICRYFSSQKHLLLLAARHLTEITRSSKCTTTSINPGNWKKTLQYHLSPCAGICFYPELCFMKNNK